MNKRVLNAILTNTKCQNFEVSSAEKTEINIKEQMETEILATKKNEATYYLYILLQGLKGNENEK